MNLQVSRRVWHLVYASTTIEPRGDVTKRSRGAKCEANDARRRSRVSNKLDCHWARNQSLFYGMKDKNSLVPCALRNFTLHNERDSRVSIFRIGRSREERDARDGLAILWGVISRLFRCELFHFVEQYYLVIFCSVLWNLGALGFRNMQYRRALVWYTRD